MYIDLLVAEIGSTTTVVNAFSGIETPCPRFVGQGQAPTSVLAGDVRVGLNEAIEDLRQTLQADAIEYGQMLATSSAAGGLRMSVHGLVFDMTARAGREAALGAGANIRMITAGKLTETDLRELEAVSPNLILLAGGTDYGERETAVYNARMIATLKGCPPVIYAGNIQCQAEIKVILGEAGIRHYIEENVYPRLDELNIEPVRRRIHDAFEEHIIHAPGMEGIRDLVTGAILPTPGAVMESARLLYGMVGDLVVVDVGGATTDVHSVADGSEEISLLQIAPEPKAKRTVEGDLGVYVNANSLAKAVGLGVLEKESGVDVEAVLANFEPIPRGEDQRKLTQRLAYHAAAIALKRHAGRLRHTYGATGRRTWAEGKDLSCARWLVATGGALTRLPGREAILRELCDLNASGTLLFPKPGSMRVLEDAPYIMASLGVISKTYPEAARALLRGALGLPT